MKSNIYIIKKENFILFYDFEKNLFIKPKNNKLKAILLKTISESCYLTKDLQEKLHIEFENKHSTNTFNTFDFFTKVHNTTDKITLMISQDCNLRCKYCYGGESGKYGEATTLMSYNTAKKSIDYLISKTQNSKVFYINFFGGEPLLNYSTLKKTVEYCNKLQEQRGITFHYSMTSNLTILSKQKAEFLKKNNFGITVSLDGPQLINDQKRIFKNGKGTYNRVLKNIEILKNFDISFTIRGTIEKNNYYRYEEIYDFLKSLNTKTKPQLSVESYYNDNDLNSFPLTDGISKYFKYILKYNDESFENFLENKSGLSKGVVTSINKINNLIKTLNGCGFLRGTTAVSTDGNLYPCHRFVGMEGYQMGNVIKGENIKKIKNFCTALDKATKKCNDCFAKYICARGCIRDIAKNNLTFINFPEEYCKHLRKYTESLLIYYYKLKTERKDLFNEIIN